MLRSMTSKTRLHFARFEFKYVLPNDTRRELESELGYFLELDPYVLTQDKHKYFVRSLYYDDPVHTCYYDKIDGLKTRSKFRIRTYTRDIQTDTPVFLEIKGRHNNLVFKHRTPVGVSSEYAMPDINAMNQHLLSRADDESNVHKQFEYELLRKNIMPIALIDYERRPYISKYDPEFRVTFDEDLTGTIATGLFPQTVYTQKKLLPGYSVLEVKFRYHVPAWFHRIIQAYELRRVSLSKICLGMEVLQIVSGDL